MKTNVFPPRPWRVVYGQLFDTWHPQSSPYVVDADGEFVLRPPQSADIGHPGEYDAKADAIAQAVVFAVNSVTIPEVQHAAV